MATKAAKQEYKREQLLEMIEQRARAADLDPQVVIRVAELESSLRPSARNRRSTATGLFQLTDARRRELGLPPKKVLSVEEDIEYGVRSLAEARDYLKERLGREPEPFELYAAHFSGPKRSVDVLSAPESTPVDRIYSRVAMRSNPDLKGLTVGQVRGRWQERFGDVGRRPQPVPKKEFVPGPPLTLPEMEREAALQLFAQAPMQEPVQEPTAMEPVMMAGGGLVGESEEITRLINMARSDADYRRINEMLSGARPAAQFNQGGEAKSRKSARDDLDDFMDRAVADRVRGAAESPQYGELVEFLADRRSMPPIKLKPGLSGGEFEYHPVFGNTLPRTGNINVGFNSDPGTIVHELTHAADRQITQQYYETRRKKNPSDIEKQFVQAFEKLVFSPDKRHSDPTRNQRTAMAFKLDPAWAVEQREYRSDPDELVAFGMGSTLTPNRRFNRAPLHVDPTMATEFSTLLDLAKRLQKSKPITDKR